MKKRAPKPKPRPKSHVRRARKAVTADVLATSGQRDKVPRKWQRHYQRLLQLRDNLMRERGALKRTASEESPQFSLHLADAGTDSYDRDMALGMLSNDQGALYEVEQALHRIRDGTYGICEVTNKPIKLERLDAIPWTRFSAAAEKQLEMEGRAESRLARLGDRETLGAPEAAGSEAEEG